MTGQRICRFAVFVWGIDQWRGCLRPRGHDGPHRDGVHWWDDDGLIVPRSPKRPTVGRGMPAGRRTRTDEHEEG